MMQHAWKLRLIHRHLLAVAVAMLAMAAPAVAAEIHTNGRGGGDWSDPDTWHDGNVPTADDVAVIAMRDTVRVNTPDAQCAGLYLDPEAVLTFPETDQHLTLTVAGPIDSYGIIRMDATQSPRGIVELRLTGDSNANRTITLRQHASILAYGREMTGSASGNVRFVAPPIGEGEGAKRVAGLITSSHADVAVDIQHAQLADLRIQLSGIDNTGGNKAQRLNIIGNRFEGYATLRANYCDTPAIRDNTFDAGDVAVGEPAIHCERGKLNNIRGNRITGKYNYAIYVAHDTDSTVRNNVITGADRGIYMRGQNGMLTGNTVTGSEIGLMIHHGSAIGEDLLMRNCKVGYDLHHSSAQLTSSGVLDVPEGGLAMKLNEASASLLNSNISDDLIKREGKPPSSGDWVETFQFLVVGFPSLMQDGGEQPKTLPEQVQVQTAEVSGGVPKGKADLNVRNAPAPVTSLGLTPLPHTTRALTLKSWRIGRDGKRVNAPFFDLIVLDAEGKTINKQMIEPSEVWYRPEPNAAKPTMEVTLP